MSLLLVVPRVAHGGHRWCYRGVKMMAARTINPGQPRTCERPRQVQLLVDAVIPRTCPTPHDATPMSARVTRVVPVRICRRRDLERGCRPKLCKCPQKKLPPTAAQRLGCLAVFGAKGLTIAGLVYWTVAEGIWGEPEDSEDFYLRIKDAWSMEDCYDETYDRKLPSLEVMKFQLKDSYNRAVITVMGLLVDIPIKLGKAIKDVLYPCELPPPVETEEKKPVEFKCD